MPCCTVSSLTLLLIQVINLQDAASDLSDAFAPNADPNGGPNVLEDALGPNVKVQGIRIEWPPTFYDFLTGLGLPLSAALTLLGMLLALLAACYAGHKWIMKDSAPAKLVVALWALCDFWSDCFFLSFLAANKPLRHLFFWGLSFLLLSICVNALFVRHRLHHLCTVPDVVSWMQVQCSTAAVSVDIGDGRSTSFSPLCSVSISTLPSFLVVVLLFSPSFLCPPNQNSTLALQLLSSPRGSSGALTTLVSRPC